MVLDKMWILNVLITLIYSHNHHSHFEFDNFFKDNVRLRSKFLDKKKQKEKIELFDKINSNKTVFVENILHLFSNNSKVLKIEDSFRNLLAMKGVKYIFKRDFFWRTWRQVEENGNLTMVCYRCQNNKDGKCQNGGYWVIEEKPPPCPYEIFSLKTDWEICAVDYNQYPDPNSCPSVINRLDLKAACVNPIKTRWRITRKYDEVSERSGITVICQGRENCEISTLYTIQTDMIVFRIINSTNHIFYSRVMKTGFKNYVCIDDCGKIDPKTNLISKKEQPYRLDLFKKNKREDIFPLTSMLPVQKKKYSKHEPNKENFLLGLHLGIENNKIRPKEPEPYLFEVNTSCVPKSTCKKIAERYFEKENSRDY